jgi:uncharacterized protein YhfF
VPSPDLPSSLADLQRWGFAEPGPLRDELTALALAGTKTTTAGLLVESEAMGETIPGPGFREFLLDSAERPVAVVETVECPIKRLADVDDRHAIDEGEGYANAAEFRVAHERFWNSLHRRHPAVDRRPDVHDHGRHADPLPAIPDLATINPDTGDVAWREAAASAT